MIVVRRLSINYHLAYSEHYFFESPRHFITKLIAKYKEQSVGRKVLRSLLYKTIRKLEENFTRRGLS